MFGVKDQEHKTSSIRTILARQSTIILLTVGSAKETTRLSDKEKQQRKTKQLTNRVNRIARHNQRCDWMKPVRSERLKEREEKDSMQVYDDAFCFSEFDSRTRQAKKKKRTAKQRLWEERPGTIEDRKSRHQEPTKSNRIRGESNELSDISWFSIDEKRSFNVTFSFLASQHIQSAFDRNESKRKENAGLAWINGATSTKFARKSQRQATRESNYPQNERQSKMTAPTNNKLANTSQKKTREPIAIKTQTLEEHHANEGYTCKWEPQTGNSRINYTSISIKSIRID